MEQYFPEFPEKRTTLWSVRKYSYHHFVPFDWLPEFKNFRLSGWFTFQELKHFWIQKSRHFWLNAGIAPGPSTLPMAMWFALTSYHWAFFIWLCWWLPLGLSKRRTVVCGWPSPGRSQDDLLYLSQDKTCFSLSFSVKNIPLIHYLGGELYYFLSPIFVIYTLFLNELMTLYFKQCSLPYGPFSITMRLNGSFFILDNLQRNYHR